MNIEKVTVVKGRWQRLHTVIDGVRYYEIHTRIKQIPPSSANRGVVNLDQEMLD